MCEVSANIIATALFKCSCICIFCRLRKYWFYQNKNLCFAKCWDLHFSPDY